MNKPARRSRFSASDGRKFQVKGAPPAGESAADDSAEEHASFPLPLNADELDGPSSASTERNDTPDFEDNVTAPATDTLAAGFQPLTGRRPRPGAKRRLSFVAMALLLLAGGLIGTVLGYSALRRPAVAPATAQENPQLGPEESHQLDEALDARHANNLPVALAHFTTLAQKYPRWTTLQVELARTQLYAGNLAGAGATLRGILKNDRTCAEANFLLGTICHVQTDYVNADAYFAIAAASDPFRADYDYFWGESLRADGKVLDAAAKFRAALSRNQYETATGLYRAKLWLCEIEGNLEKANGTDAAIDAALAAPYPPMEALIAAAARDLKAGNSCAAAQHLAAARLRTDPVIFPVLLHDPFFVQYESVPELAEFLRPPPPVSPPSRVDAPAAFSPPSLPTPEITLQPVPSPGLVSPTP